MRRLRSIVLAASAAVAASATLAAGAQASTFTVTSLGDNAATSPCTLVTGTQYTCATLRDAVTESTAIAYAGDADTINFQTGLTGTITLAGAALPLGPTTGGSGEPPTSIIGPGAGQLTITGDGDGIPGPSAGDSRILSTSGGSNWIVSGMTMTGGAPQGGDTFGGAIRNDFSTLTLTGTVITANTASGPAGGAIESNGPLTINSSTISDNSSGGIGGAIRSLAPLVITGSTLSQNTAPASGGAIAGSGEVTISGSTITANTAGTDGGAISTSGALSIQGSTISGNQVTNGSGGAIAIAGSNALVIAGSTISQNTVDGFGGGLSIVLGGRTESSISTTTISANTATQGGAGVQIGGIGEGGRLSVFRSTLSGNSTLGYGGGALISGIVSGQLQLSDSTISANSAGAGGGISVGSIGGSQPIDRTGSLGIANSTIAGNTAGTLSDGAETASGGGIYLGPYTDGPATKSPTVLLESSIVADNIAAGSPSDLDRADLATSGGADAYSSLIEAPGTTPVAVNSQSPSLIGADPQLGALAANGGPTNTMLPATTSPVIDQGDSPPRLAVDQRGEPRRQVRTTSPQTDGTDIGAVELPAQTPIPPIPPDTTPPATRVTKKPKATLRTKKGKVRVAISFAADEAGATFQCKIDKAAYRTCSSPLHVSLKAKPRKGARHTILIRATDAAGNAGSPVTVRVKVVRKPKKHR